MTSEIVSKLNFLRVIFQILTVFSLFCRFEIFGTIITAPKSSEVLQLWRNPFEKPNYQQYQCHGWSFIRWIFQKVVGFLSFRNLFISPSSFTLAKALEFLISNVHKYSAQHNFNRFDSIPTRSNFQIVALFWYFFAPFIFLSNLNMLKLSEALQFLLAPTKDSN